MNEEETKEIKNLNEIELTSQGVEIAVNQEMTPVETTIPQQEENEENKKEKKPMNKKLIFIIVGILTAIFLIIGIVLLIIPKQDKTESKDKEKEKNLSAFEKVVTKALKNGDLAKEINKGLEENAISTEEVYVISMDIDSDDNQELVVYAEDGNKKYILQLEIDETITYDDSYPMTSKSAIGYAYSSEKNQNYWYTENNGNYTIISSTKKIIKEEDFLENYFSLTQTYKEKAILMNAIEYNMDKDLDVKELEKNAITKEKILKDNDIDEKDIKDAYKKYKEEKEEEEKKKKEEEEKQAAEEELQKKLSGTLKLGTKNFKFGTYNIYDTNGNLDGKLILYADMTCEHKGVTCTYTVGSARDSKENEVPGISLSTGHIYIVSKTEGELTDEKETIAIRYAG